MGKRATTVVLWFALIAFFLGVYVSPVFRTACIGAVFGALAVFLGLVLLGAGRVVEGLPKIAALALVAATAGGGAAWVMAGGVAVAGSLAVTLGPIVWLAVWNAWHRRQLSKLAEELEAGGRADERIERLGRWGTWAIAGVLEVLSAHERHDAVVRILTNGRHALGMNGTWYHANALLALGHVDEAKRITASVSPWNDFTVQAMTILEARIALADGGDATEAIARLERAEVDGLLAPFRLEVLADAYAAKGDRDRAHEVLRELRPSSRLEGLARSHRPSAAIAKELVDGSAAPPPYR